MLVLSRRCSEKIVFPEIGVTLHVLGTKGQVARIGIEAPPEVPVLRGELAPAAAPSAEHLLRDRLREVTLALHLLERQWEVGRPAEARETLDNLFARLEALKHDLAAARGRANRPDGPGALRQVRGDRGLEGLPDAWFPKPLDLRKLWEAMQETLAGRN
jgi:carbon storage regulator CsrA